MSLQSALLQLTKGGPEQQAIDAGEIDAIVDYSSSNVILFPAARRALHASGSSLLAALPGAEYRQLLVGLEPVTLKLGQVLHEPAVPIRYIYFPVGCVVSLMTTVADGKAVEVGLVGYEGIVGLALGLGAAASSVRAVVAASGAALRIEAARFRSTLPQCPSLQQELYRHTDAMLAQARQTIACNCFHLSDARLARWLLMTSDRAQSQELFLTQSFLATMLGLRRVTVTEIAGRLWRRKLISCGRGRIRILDRPGLEAAACRCYSRIERQQLSG
ncbi:MAG TPA: Crp/Fnr family transcriptional regulator [Steroidobacteraceae bacterium]|jgi:CRP-like cAMP-binding protein|nr:Crp/Fnr family transcriptional regulator [Steroidobacteraceae bacterium]